MKHREEGGPGEAWGESPLNQSVAACELGREADR